MTAAAVRAEAPVVRVVRAMAGDAARRHGAFVRGLAMAVPATEPFVRPGQTETGLPRVVELPEPPAVRVVAGAACRPERAAVHILAPVAVDALVGGLAIGAARMAVLAGDADVQPDQREARQVMVEPHRIAPSRFAVTGRAVAPE